MYHLLLLKSTQCFILFSSFTSFHIGTFFFSQISDIHLQIEEIGVKLLAVVVGPEVHPVQTGMILGGRQGNGISDKLCVCIPAPLIVPGLPGLPHRKDMGKHQR